MLVAPFAIVSRSRVFGLLIRRAAGVQEQNASLASTSMCEKIGQRAIIRRSSIAQVGFILVSGQLI
jgi:hypothetical protein